MTDMVVRIETIENGPDNHSALVEVDHRPHDPVESSWV